MLHHCHPTIGNATPLPPPIQQNLNDRLLDIWWWYLPSSLNPRWCSKILSWLHPDTYLHCIYQCYCPTVVDTSCWIAPCSDELSIQLLVRFPRPIQLDILSFPSLHASTLSCLSHGHQSCVGHQGFQNDICLSYTIVMYVWHVFHHANSNGASRRVVADNNSGALIFSTSQYVVIRSSSTWVVVMLSLGKIDHTFWA